MLNQCYRRRGQRYSIQATKQQGLSFPKMQKYRSLYPVLVFDCHMVCIKTVLFNVKWKTEPFPLRTLCFCGTKELGVSGSPNTSWPQIIPWTCTTKTLFGQVRRTISSLCLIYKTESMNFSLLAHNWAEVWCTQTITNASSIDQILKVTPVASLFLFFCLFFKPIYLKKSNKNIYFLLAQKIPKAAHWMGRMGSVSVLIPLSSMLGKLLICGMTVGSDLCVHYQCDTCMQKVPVWYFLLVQPWVRLHPNQWLNDLVWEDTGLLCLPILICIHKVIAIKKSYCVLSAKPWCVRSEYYQ